MEEIPPEWADIGIWLDYFWWMDWEAYLRLPARVVRKAMSYQQTRAQVQRARMELERG